MDSLKCSTSAHLFTLVLLHYVPWFPLSLLVGYLVSVNGIHQWLVIKWWSIMIVCDTVIHVMGHVLAMICVEDLQVWWHSIYATSLIVPIFIIFHLSWPDLSVHVYLPEVFIQYEGLIALYIVCGDDHSWHMFIIPIHDHCTNMYLGLLCILHICSHM